MAVAALSAFTFHDGVIRQKRETVDDAFVSVVVKAFVPSVPYGVSVGAFTSWQRLVTCDRDGVWFERDPFMEVIHYTKQPRPLYEAALPQHTAGDYELALIPSAKLQRKIVRVRPQFVRTPLTVIYGGETAVLLFV